MAVVPSNTPGTSMYVLVAGQFVGERLLVDLVGYNFSARFIVATAALLDL